VFLAFKELSEGSTTPAKPKKSKVKKGAKNKSKANGVSRSNGHNGEFSMTAHTDLDDIVLELENNESAINALLSHAKALKAQQDYDQVRDIIG